MLEANEEEMHQQGTCTLEEYGNPNVRLIAFLSSIGYLGLFLGLFFGSRGPDNEWPYAWWSVCFLGLAISQYFSTVNAMPAKVALVVSDKEGVKALEFYNHYGRLLDLAPLTWMDRLESRSGGWRSKLFGAHVVIQWTDEAYEARRNSVCKLFRCCIPRSTCVHLPEGADRLAHDFQSHKKGDDFV